MKKLIYALPLLCILLACQKEEIPVKYPITFVSTEYRITSGVKLFTKFGEINDRAIINRFLKAVDSGYLNPNTNAVYQVHGEDTIFYQNKDLVLFQEGSNLLKTIPEQKGEYTFFNRQQETPIPVYGNDQPQYYIASNIGISKQSISKPSYATGFAFGKYPPKIAKVMSSKIEKPLLNYHIKITGAYSNATFSRRNENNVFDANVIKLLKDGDTIAIQEGVLIYEAKK